MHLRTELILFLALISTFSQAQFSLKGKITNEHKKLISNANVILLNSVDSSIVKTDISSNSGNFLLPNIPLGSYKLKITKIGYSDLNSDQISISKDIELNFVLKESAKKLKEISITSSKPMLEQRADKLIVNVANSPLAAGGTAQDILKKVPGVVIVQDKVTLAGSGDVQIWIDGRPSVYQDINAALRTMPGDQIEKIELIKQPGAKFDAAGGPILNIVLKKNAKLGLNGNAQIALMGFQVNHADIDQGVKEYVKYNPSLSLNYRKGSLNFFGNTSFWQGKGFQAINFNRYIASNHFQTPSLLESNSEGYNLRFGADYFINKKTTIGILLKGSNVNSNRFNQILTNSYDLNSNQLTNSFYTDNQAIYSNFNYSTNFNLKHLFDTAKDHQINFDLDYIRYESNMKDNFEIYQTNTPIIKSLSNQEIIQPINLLVAKLDYSLPIDSTLKFDLGAKSSFASIDNSLKFYRGENLISSQSNQFIYTENISALYFSLNKNWKKLDFNLGLRAENTKAIGSSLQIELLNRNYLQFFPNLSLLYKLDQHLGIQLAYTKRVNRPSFNQQNPFRRFIDSLTYQTGNPNIFPEIAHNGQFSIVYDGQPFISIEYNLTDDVIIENAPKIEGNTTYTTTDNLAKKYNWTFQANFPLKFGKVIDGYAGNQLIYNHYNAKYLDNIYNESRWHWLAYIGVTAKLPNDYLIELNGFYITKFLEEFITIGAMSSFDIGISKSIFEKRGKLSLNFNDIFYGQQVYGLINYNNIKAEFLQREFSQNLRFTFSYNFGNRKLLKQRYRNTASDIENQRVKLEK